MKFIAGLLILISIIGALVTTSVLAFTHYGLLPGLLVSFIALFIFMCFLAVVNAQP